MTDATLPCPFCGNGDPVTVEGDDRWYIACRDLECFCAIGEGYDRDAMPDHTFLTEADAIAAWNRRISTPIPLTPSDGEAVPTEAQWREFLRINATMHCPVCGSNKRKPNGGAACDCGVTWVVDITEPKAAPITPSDGREQIAQNVMRWMCDDRGDWPVDSVKRLLVAKYEKHDGDCTKKPYTCLRCEADKAYAQTDEILEIVRTPITPSDEMVAAAVRVYHGFPDDMPMDRLQITFGDMKNAITAALNLMGGDK